MNKFWVAAGFILILAGVPMSAISTISEMKNNPRQFWHTIERTDLHGGEKLARDLEAGYYCLEIVDYWLIAADSTLTILDLNLQWEWYRAPIIENIELVTTHYFTLKKAGTYIIDMGGVYDLKIEIKVSHLLPNWQKTYPYSSFGVIGIPFVILGGFIVCVYLDRSRRIRTDKLSLQT